MQLKSLYDTPRKRGGLGLLVILIVSLLAYFAVSQPYVELGDKVVFHFTIGFADGTIIGTTDLNEAKLAGIYDEKTKYEPVDLIVGTGIAGGMGLLPMEVEESLLSMTIGDTRLLKVHAPYGYYDPSKVLKLSVDEFKRLTGKDPLISDEYLLLGNRVYGKVTEIKEGNVYVDVNSQFAVPLQFLEKVPIEEITKLDITPRRGMEITYKGRQAYIFDLSETEVGLDYYPPFLFKLKIISIRKGVS